MISRGGALAGYAAIGAGVAGSLGIDTSPIVAGLSVTGLTVGFAARDVASNYIAGLMLISKPAPRSQEEGKLKEEIGVGKT
jgi:small-conductance mechanosensitive channel